MSLRISHKHGVNPTIPLCYFCGQPKNEIVLLGLLPNDAEAPRNLVIDYQPCEKCREMMELGVTLVEVTIDPPNVGQPPLAHIEGEDIYPTGRWCVVKPEFIDKAINDPDLAENIKRERKAFLPPDAYAKIHGEDVA